MVCCTSPVNDVCVQPSNWVEFLGTAMYTILLTYDSLYLGSQLELYDHMALMRHHSIYGWVLEDGYGRNKAINLEFDRFYNLKRMG